MSYSNYPPGAEFDPDAPYNDPPEQVHEFSVFATVSMTCDTTVVSCDAVEIVFEDEDGYSSYLDTSNVCLRDDFVNQVYSPQELIGVLKEILLEHPEIKKFERDRYLASAEAWLEGDEEIIDVEEC